MRKYIGLVVIIVVLLTTFGLYKVLTHKTSNVLLQISPTAALVVLNNGEHLKPGEQYIKPGSYIVSASFNGFATKRASLVAKNDSTSTLRIILLPNSDAGNQYLLNHPKEQNKRESLGDKEFKKNSQARITSTPLINNLPYIERYFRVDYGASEDHSSQAGAVGIYITYYNSVGKQQALDWIQSQGTDPTTLEIIYVNQTSPSPDT